MTTPIDTDRISNPVPVSITNWAPPIKPPVIRNTSMKTYVVDPAGTGAGKSVQICDYEINRIRLAIIPIDAAVALVDVQPVTSPDTSTTAAPNAGGLLPAATQAYEFFGPDAFWINSLATITRVTVIREYTA